MSRKVIVPNIAYDDERKCFYAVMRTGGKTPRRHCRCFSTFEEAVRALQEFQCGGGSLTEGVLTTRQWLLRWFQEVVVPNRAVTTAHGYGEILQKHLIPSMGAIPLQELNPQHIQHYFLQKLDQGLCANTVRKHGAVLHAALEHAMRQGLLSRNPADAVSLPPSSPPRHHYYDPDTMAKLFQAAEGSVLEPVVKLAGYLGLRRSEICGLKWGSVDLSAHVITIEEARTAANGVSVDKDTKNASSVRRLGYGENQDLIRLMEALRQKYLQEQAMWGSEWDHRGFVISHNGGKPYQPDYISASFQKLVSQTDLPYITLHGLRHSFASIAHSRSVSLYDISKAMGHSSSATTTRVYMHLFDTTCSAVVQEVGDAIYGESRQNLTK